MPTLKEYLGSIVTSIIDSRVMSDLQVAQIAQMYLKDDLLKTFTVPRMRIEDVEVTIPVAVEKFDVLSETVYEPIDNRNFISRTYRELINSFGLSSLPRHLSLKMMSEISAQTRELEKKIKISHNLNPLQDYIATTIDFFIREAEPFKDVKKVIERKIAFTGFDQLAVSNRLVERLKREIKIVSEKKILENLNVNIETAQIKEQVPQSLMYIKLKITETGMEWHRIENLAGEIENKLIEE